MHISFDLDGTIIDSLDSVKNSFQRALKINHVETKKEIIVGPPLDSLVSTHVGDNAHLRRLVRNSFMKEYDENFAITAKLYSGVECVLRSFMKSNNVISLVTNKRRIPTHKILKQLNLIDIFDLVICSDEYEYGSSKSERLLNIRLKDTDNIYIGDTQEDCIAAKKAHYKFLGVAWGYGNISNSAMVRSPHEIEKYVNG